MLEPLGSDSVHVYEQPVEGRDVVIAAQVLRRPVDDLLHLLVRWVQYDETPLRANLAFAFCPLADETGLKRVDDVVEGNYPAVLVELMDDFRQAVVIREMKPAEVPAREGNSKLNQFSRLKQESLIPSLMSAKCGLSIM